MALIDETKAANRRYAGSQAADPAAYNPYSYGAYAYQPTRDFSGQAASMANEYANLGMIDNETNRKRAIQDWALALAVIEDQANSGVRQAEVAGEELRSRTNNMMASRGIGRGVGAGINMARVDASQVGAIADIRKKMALARAQAEVERQRTIDDTFASDNRLKSEARLKAQELAMAMEDRDFNRWAAITGMNAADRRAQEEWNAQMYLYDLQKQDQATADASARRDQGRAEIVKALNEGKDAAVIQRLASYYGLGPADYMDIMPNSASDPGGNYGSITGYNPVKRSFGDVWDAYWSGDWLLGDRRSYSYLDQGDVRSAASSIEDILRAVGL